MNLLHKTNGFLLNKKTIDMLFLLYNLFYVFLWRSLMYGYGYSYVIYIVFLIYYGFYYNKSIIDFIKRYKWFSLATIIMFVFSSFKNFYWDNYYINVFQLILPGLLVPINICLILKYLPKVTLTKILDNLTIFFNIYFIINVIIIFLQFDESYFLIRKIENGNPFYLDHITGLIGLSGTHILSFFWIVLLLANLFKIIERKSFKTIGLTIIELALMLFISSRNDNKFFYILLLLFFVLFLSIYYYEKISINKLKVFKIIVVSLISIGAVVIFLNSLNLLPNQIRVVLSHINNYIYALTSGEYSQSTERLLLIEFSLKLNGNIFLGDGYGAIIMLNPPGFPLHFGMNDASSLLYIGGICSTSIIFYTLSKLMYTCLNCNKLLVKILIVMLTVIMFVYTNIITVTAMSILYVFCFIFLGRIWSTKYEKK